MKTKIPEKIINKTFDDRKNEFDKELSFLLNKYSLKLWVVIEPINFLARLLKKLIQINWRIVVIDSTNQQK